MSRKLFLIVTAGIVSAVVFGQVVTVRAALCEKCRDLMFVDSQGRCIDCGGPTGSTALQLCPQCSARRRQCEHCLAKLTGKEETAAESPPVASGADGTPPASGYPAPAALPAWSAPSKIENAPKDDSRPLPSPVVTPDASPAPAASPSPTAAATPALAQLKPINPAASGTYTAGNWRFQLQIGAVGTRNEGRWGWLTYAGQKLPRGNINDYYITPWGPMYWVGVPTTSWGLHGFMPIPTPQSPRPGKALALPASLVAAVPAAGSSPLPEAVAATPKVQTLEINRANNGQLARLHVGNVLVIRLPGNPASGYEWQVGTTNTTALRLTVQPQYSPPAGAAGGAAVQGAYTFVYQAVQPGNGSLRLYYVRPGDPRRPRDMFAIGVSVAPAATGTPPRSAARAAESR